MAATLLYFVLAAVGVVFAWMSWGGMLAPVCLLWVDLVVFYLVKVRMPLERKDPIDSCVCALTGNSVLLLGKRLYLLQC